MANSLITETIAVFSEATISHDFAKMTNLFAEDAVWEANGDGLAFSLSGIESIRNAFVKNNEVLEVIFQQMGIPLIKRISDNEASSVTSVTELLRFKASGEIKKIMGIYRDQLRYDGEKWIFKHRLFKVRHSYDLNSSKALV